MCLRGEFEVTNGQEGFGMAYMRMMTADQADNVNRI